MTIALRGDIDDHIDVEAGTSLNDSLRVLCNFFIQDIVGLIGSGTDSILMTDTDTSAAAYAFAVINGGFPVCYCDGAVSTDFGAHFAADAQILIYVGFAGTVHFHFSGPGPTAHADVFKSAAKTGTFMSLKMSQRDENIGVHNSPSDFGLFDVLAALYRDERLIGSL